MAQAVTHGTPYHTVPIEAKFERKGPPKSVETPKEDAKVKDWVLQMLFGEEFAMSDRLLHVQFPQMLYNVEMFVFGTGAFMGLLYLLSSPTNAALGTNATYSVTLVTLASAVATGIAFQTRTQIKKAFPKSSADAAAMRKEGTALDANAQKELTAYLNNNAMAIHAKKTDDGKFVYPESSDPRTLAKQKADLENHLELIRYAGAIVCGPLMLFALYNMIPMGKGQFLTGKGMAAGIFVCGPLGATLSRLWLFDFQKPGIDRFDWGIGFFLLLVVVGGGGFFTVFFDIIMYDGDNPLKDNIFFFLISSVVGYGLAFGGPLAVRMMEHCRSTGAHKTTKEGVTTYTMYSTVKQLPQEYKRAIWPDTWKHFFYVATDILVLGFLVFGTLFYVYGRPFTDTRLVLNMGEIVASPPPPPPPHPPLPSAP